MKVVELRRENLGVLRAFERSRFYVVLYTADYGCAECEVLEELIKVEGLEDLIDLKVVVTHEEESIALALELGVDVLPLVVVGSGGSKLRIDDPDPIQILLKLKEVLRSRIELYETLRKQYEEYSRKLSEVLGRKVEVNYKLIPLLVKRVEDFGKPYCPCRTEISEKTVCPCVYHVEELRKYGRCRCGLFRLENSF